MRLLGFNITREKAAGQRSAVDDRRGWYPLVKESFAGAWQKNVEIKLDSVLSFHAVFACQTLIASDIAKNRIKLVQQDSDGVWSEVRNPAYTPVLRKPNHFQTRIQFLENWILSKLQTGNTYVLKQRDGRGVVTKLYVLDPTRVKPLVADNGEVFYQLSTDRLSGLEAAVIVPAREIIHDRFNCFFHPLVGLSPVFANGLAAMQGLSIQTNSANFFANNSQPGGILTAPGAISDPTAERLKQTWKDKYSGANVGSVAVLGDGLKYEALSIPAKDAQLIEQLKWSAEVVCSTYHVPPYKIGIGQMPSYNNVQALNTEYYSQCLQILIEAMEVCLDEGLGTGDTLGTELDLANLLRMDSVTQMEVLDKASGVLTIDEKRAMLDKKKVTGGDSVYLQQQEFSLAALAKRDAREDPFATGSSSTSPSASAANDNQMQAEAKKALHALSEGFS